MAKMKKSGRHSPMKQAAVDEELDESFPASDPPAFMGGNHFVGGPPRRSKARKPRAPAKVKKAATRTKPKAKKKKRAKRR